MKRDNINLLEGNPLKLIISFSVPLVFGNIFQQLYYLTDAAVVGNYISIQALAAVNSCSWLTWLLNAVARDFSNTLSILASYSIGEKDSKKLNKIVGSAGTILIMLAVLLTILAECNLERLFVLFQVEGNIVDMTRDYFSIVLLGIPFVLINNAASALLRAMGNSRVTFDAIAVSTVMNVALDFLFIVAFNWGVAGGALATIIAQFAAMLISVIPLIRSPLFTARKDDCRLDPGLVKEMADLWFPMFVNSAVITIGGIFVSSNVNAIGAFFTAGISSGTKIFTLLESVIMAIQTGLSVFIGQNIGALKLKRVRRGQRQVVLFSLGFVVIINIVVQSAAPQLANIFLQSGDLLYERTLQVAVTDIRVSTLGMLIMAPMYLYRAAIQTLGHPRYPMYAGFLQLAARIFSVTVLPPVIGDYGYYLATVLAWLVTLPVVVISYYYYVRYPKLKK